MKVPSRQWKSVRRSVLERVQRCIIEPLDFLSTVHLVTCGYFIFGYANLKFFLQQTDFSTLASVQILLVATAGFMVPILTGALTLLLVLSRRIHTLESEYDEAIWHSRLHCCVEAAKLDEND